MPHRDRKGLEELNRKLQIRDARARLERKQQAKKAKKADRALDRANKGRR